MNKLHSLLDRDVSKKRITAEDADGARERLKGFEGDGTAGSALGPDTELVIEVCCEWAELIRGDTRDSRSQTRPVQAPWRSATCLDYSRQQHQLHISYADSCRR